LSRNRFLRTPYSGDDNVAKSSTERRPHNSARRLRLVEGVIGAADQPVRCFHPIPLGCADRAGQRRRVRNAHPIQALGRAGKIGVAEKDDKLFAAVAGDAILRAQAVAPDLGCSFEVDIAGLVAELIIEILEPVEVDHGQADRAAVAPRGGQARCKRPVEGTTIFQSSEIVGAGGEFQQLHHV
jgi:hypothetical protein